MLYKILVADDDYFYRKLIQKHLTQYKYLEVMTVCDGESVSSLVESERVDILILDFHLPLKNAEQILTDLHTTGSAIPVIVITGDDSVETEMAVKSLGAEYFITKPIDLMDLEFMITSILFRNAEKIETK